MVDHVQMHLAMQQHLLLLAVCTTGATGLSATAGGYARAAGSFRTDGFAPGMEVVPTGFAQTTNSVALEVTDLTLTVDGGRTPQAVGAGRVLAVGLPSRRQWENVELKIVDAGWPWVEEQYLPGSMDLLTIGDHGILEVEPMYSLLLRVPQNGGWLGAMAYATAIVRHFAPKTCLTLTNGDKLRVRGDTAPFVGQLIKDAPSWAVVPVTVPFRLETTNTI